VQVSKVPPLDLVKEYVLKTISQYKKGANEPCTFQEKCCIKKKNSFMISSNTISAFINEYAFLSNDYKVSITYDNRKYNSVTEAMAAITIESKKWTDEKRLHLLESLLHLKFHPTYNPTLMEKLIKTHPKRLENHQKGIRYDPDEDVLGTILMKVRSELVRGKQTKKAIP
jgi:hypothetical protein